MLSSFSSLDSSLIKRSISSCFLYSSVQKNPHGLCLVLVSIFAWSGPRLSTSVYYHRIVESCSLEKTSEVF